MTRGSPARRWLAAAATLLAFGAAGLALAFWPEPGERAARLARPIPTLAEGSFDSVEVFAKGAWTTLRRDAGDPTGSRFVALAGTTATPGLWAADPDGARAAFAALVTLDLTARVTERKDRHAELEVDEARGVRVRVPQRDAGAERAGAPAAYVVDLVIGKAAGGGTFLRLAGSDQVWRANGELRATFDRSTSDWRDRGVARFDPDQARELVVTTRDGARIVVRRAPELGHGHPSVEGFGSPGGLAHARWEIREASVRIEKLDQGIPREILATLSSLEASGFADDVAPAAAGLEPAALTVRVELSDGGAGHGIAVAVGDPVGADETFVKVVGAPQIFRVKRFNVDRINRRPVQFRDKSLCNISDADVVAFAVTHGDDSYAVVRGADGWRATRPSGLVLDPEKVAPLATVFRSWNAPRIAEDVPASAAGAPRAVITGRSKTGSCTIFVGGEPANTAGYFVRTATSSDVYIVPKWMVDRIAVPLGDLRKS